MIKKCMGCGAALQCLKPEIEGYVESDLYEKASVCRRCFRLKCYGDYVFINKSDEDYYTILEDVNKTNDLVLYLVDIFNTSNSIKDINKYLHNPMILVLSKRDILPKSIKDKKIIEWLKPLSSNIVDVISISTEKNYNLDKLYNSIIKHKMGNNVYVVGNTNAGKSTLINKLISNYSNNEASVTTSIMPSTTLQMLEVRLNDDITLIDTPGLVDKGSIINDRDYIMVRKITPKKEIKPITYQLEANDSLIIDNMVRIDNLEGRKNGFTIFLSNELTVDRINFNTNNKLRNLKRHTFSVNGKEDIVINGLGWIKIVKETKVDIYVLDKVEVYKRDSLV